MILWNFVGSNPMSLNTSRRARTTDPPYWFNIVGPPFYNTLLLLLLILIKYYLWLLSLISICSLIIIATIIFIYELLFIITLTANISSFEMSYHDSGKRGSDCFDLANLSKKLRVFFPFWIFQYPIGCLEKESPACVESLEKRKKRN